MKDYDLSILIPARNEMFLRNTVEDILKHKEGKTEIIIGLDGLWSNPPIKDHPDVTIIHVSESIGQRAMTNQCANLSRARFLMKCDAHCAFDQGFDRILLADMQDNWTMVPIMRNLWAFDWKCKKCGAQTYQGPTPVSCAKCDNRTDFERVIYWIGKKSPQSSAFMFDTDPHFQYFPELKRRQVGDLVETMSLQGSCFLMTRAKYWELSICDENFGSWGSQGIEVAVKTWLSGGRVICNRKTWYAHMFRTQGGDFSFPYNNPGSKVQTAKKIARDLFFNNKWEKQIYPLSWLIEKFKPIPDWHDEKGKQKLAEVNKSGEEFYISHPRPKAESLSKSL